MKITVLRCPNCDGPIENDKQIIFCSFCGAELSIDDDTKDVNITYKKDINISRKYINEAKIMELQIKKEEGEAEKKSEKKVLIGCAVIVLVFFSFVGLMAFIESGGLPGTVLTPSSSRSFHGSNFEQVVRELESAGFTNIELVRQEDLTLGILARDGSVSRITINGVANFSRNARFRYDAHVIITYRTFPRNEESP